MTESEFLSRIYFRKSDSDVQKQIIRDLKEGRFSRVSKEYERKTHVPVIYIVTTGKGERETFEKAFTLYADFGIMGEKQGLAYLYDDSREFGMPKRFIYEKDRILIDNYRS